MVRPLCSRQGEDLSKNLREALRSLPWDTHHVTDVAGLRFCLLSRYFSATATRLTRLTCSVGQWNEPENNIEGKAVRQAECEHGKRPSFKARPSVPKF